MIQLKQVSKQYSKNTIALDDINLTIQPSEIFGIIGRSGAGKSTLVRCMNLLEHPTSGQVMVDGNDLTLLSIKALRQARLKIGMIFQHFNLLSSRNVFRNVALPLELIGLSKKEIKIKVDRLLSLVGLSEYRDADTQNLSGGQKQRVAIARALASDPAVLLCDEATSSLDPETTKSILSLLKEINKRLGLTIVLITHEMDVIKQICDRVAVLDKGRIVEQGDVVDIFVEPKDPTTKSLTQKSLHIELPEIFLKQIVSEPTAGKNPVLRLAFVGDATREPVLVNIVRQYNVIVNFLQADFEYIKESQVGITICQLIGESADIQRALHYLHDNKVKVEVLGYA